MVAEVVGDDHWDSMLINASIFRLWQQSSHIERVDGINSISWCLSQKSGIDSTIHTIRKCILSIPSAHSGQQSLRCWYLVDTKIVTCTLKKYSTKNKNKSELKMLLTEGDVGGENRTSNGNSKQGECFDVLYLFVQGLHSF